MRKNEYLGLGLMVTSSCQVLLLMADMETFALLSGDITGIPHFALSTVVIVRMRCRGASVLTVPR